MRLLTLFIVGLQCHCIDAHAESRNRVAAKIEKTTEEAHLPFYLRDSAANRGHLMLLENDVVLGERPSTDFAKAPPVAVFAYLPFSRPQVRTFFKEFLPTFKSRFVDQRKALFIPRPHPDDVGSIYLYRLSQCLPDDKQWPFLRDAVLQQNRWSKRTNPTKSLARIADPFGMTAKEVSACLGDREAIALVYAQLDKAKRLTRRKSGSVFSVNSYYFPGLLDKDIFREALMRAVSKLSRKRPISAADSADIMALGDDDISLGAADAPLRLIHYTTLEFADLHDFHAHVLPKLKADYIDTGKLLYVERLYPWFQAGEAATASLLCAPKDAYFHVAPHLTQDKAAWRPRRPWLENKKAEKTVVSLIRRNAPVKASKLRACMRSAATRKRIDRQRTFINDKADMFYNPTFFLNGRELLKPRPYHVWKTMLDSALEQHDQNEQAKARLLRARTEIEQEMLEAMKGLEQAQRELEAAEQLSQESSSEPDKEHLLEQSNQALELLFK